MDIIENYQDTTTKRGNQVPPSPQGFARPYFQILNVTQLLRIRFGLKF